MLMLWMQQHLSEQFLSTWIGQKQQQQRSQQQQQQQQQQLTWIERVWSTAIEGSVTVETRGAETDCSPGSPIDILISISYRYI